MNHDRRAPLALLLTLLGCVLPDSKLGEGPETTGSSDDTSSTPIETTETGAAGIGSPCDHGAAAGFAPESKLLTSPAPACAGDVCLYADASEAPSDACESTADCNAANPALGRFVCNLADNRCELSPDYFLERSMCSGYCEEDADCAAVESTTCQTGFACEPMSSIGEACCRPVCVCRDDLDQASASSLRSSCEDGTQEGCCEITPGNGLCPD